MPDSLNSLQLATKILRRERELNPLYSQLQSQLTDRRQIRAVRRLRSLQSQQITGLSDLINELEDTQPPPVDRRYAQHILQPGETLSVLAREYNTTVSEIRRVNPGLPEDPGAGQVVNLPIEIPKPPARSFRYIVRRGDTLFRIANRFSTDVDTLVRLNNIADPDVIFPGRILIVPNS